MKKRLRKKLRLQEFQEIGFYASLKLNISFAQDTKSGFWKKLFDFVKAQDLSIKGSTSGFHVTHSKRGVTTETDREALVTWLHQQPEVLDVKVWTLYGT